MTRTLPGSIVVACCTTPEFWVQRCFDGLHIVISDHIGTDWVLNYHAIHVITELLHIILDYICTKHLAIKYCFYGDKKIFKMKPISSQGNPLNILTRNSLSTNQMTVFEEISNLIGCCSSERVEITFFCRLMRSWPTHVSQTQKHDRLNFTLHTISMIIFDIMGYISLLVNGHFVRFLPHFRKMMTASRPIGSGC